MSWPHQREWRDAAPGDEPEQAGVLAERVRTWRERWRGLSRWFISEGHIQVQSELLRARVRATIPQLLAAVASLNERRSGRSDRSTDFRVLARWFADTADDAQAHRRAGFALNPARDFSLPEDLVDAAAIRASTSWADAPPVRVHPSLREQGELTPRGAVPDVRAHLCRAGADRCGTGDACDRQNDAPVGAQYA